jgi:hypothetical protein
LAEHLWPQLRLKADTDAELKEKYRKIYLETYVRDAEGREIKIYDWNGRRILFHAGTFDHAFSESSDYRYGDGTHDLPFSKRRARCILWIKEVLAATRGTIECRQQMRPNSRGKTKKRRVLLVVEEKYVVVLEARDKSKEMDFVTAFVADFGYIKKIQREGGWVETKKSPSLNGD